jgi:hypothetical protein
MAPPSALQSLMDGRRYSHEIDNPKPIPLENQAMIMDLLKNFFKAYQIHSTLSIASRTSGRTQSESSFGTSRTDASHVWSAASGSAIQEEGTRHLSDFLKARKALVRKLKACPLDCQLRKVRVS